MNILRISSLKSEETSRTMSLKQNYWVLLKKDCISFVYNKERILLWIIAPTISKML